MSAVSASIAAARGASRTLDRLLEHPRTVLGVLIAAQLVATLAFALSASHNGWVYYQGGDQIINTTTGWLLGRFELPPTEVGYLWPLIEAPITWFTGPTYVQALPALVVLQVLVFGPLALVCLYGIASGIGGRLLGYWTALLWIVAPFAAIPLFVDRYHEKWVDQFLPQALGLTAASDYASMVSVLAAAFFVVRSTSPGYLPDAALGGLLFGAAMGMKPSNALFAVGAGVAYLIVRCWREALAFALASVPSLLVLALWKYKGLGELPLLAPDAARLAAGSGPVALDVGRYIDLDVNHWREQMNNLREFFWSARLAQWVPFAGLLAVLRMRKWAIAGLLAGWLGAYLVIKGFSQRASIESGSFWRFLMPAWPAYLLLFASIPLLVPTLVRRIGDRVRSPRASSPVAWHWVALAGVVTIALPAVATAVSSRIEPPTPAVVQEFPSGNILTPVDESIRVRVTRVGDGQRLTWTSGPWRSAVFYRIYRNDRGGSDVDCALSAGTAWSCYLRAIPIATTRGAMFVDRSAPPGATYRVGVGTNWRDDPELGDVFALSPQVSSAPKA